MSWDSAVPGGPTREDPLFLVIVRKKSDDRITRVFCEVDPVVTGRHSKGPVSRSKVTEHPIAVATNIVKEIGSVFLHHRTRTDRALEPDIPRAGWTRLKNDAKIFPVRLYGNINIRLCLGIY